MNYKVFQQLYESIAHSTTPTKDEPAADNLLDPKEKALVEEVEARIAHAKLVLYDKAPYLGRRLSRLNVKIVKSDSPEVPTMAVDDRGNIYVNPDFSGKISVPEFYGVFAHEAMHHANGTFLRRENRNPYIWNLATDAQINWALLRDGFQLPKGAILPDVNSGVYKLPNSKPPAQINVLDAKGAPISCEEIYEQFVKIMKTQPPPALPGGQNGQPDSGPGPKGPQDPGETGTPGRFPTGGPGVQPGKPGKNPTSGQGGKSEGKPEDKPGGKGAGSWEDYFKGLDNKTDKHLTEAEAAKVKKGEVEKALSAEEIKELENQRRNDIRAGEQEAKRRAQAARGQGVGGIRGIVSKSIPIKVDWKGVIRRYLTAANSSVRTWLKPNIKAMAGGYQSPGKTTSPLKLEAIFAIDTSGSIGSEELSQAANFARQIAAETTNINVRIVLWHSLAYWISQPLTSKGALETTLSKMVTQSGGTELGSVADLLAKQKIRPKVTIYITDGYTESRPRMPPGEHLFIVVNNAAQQEEFKAKIAELYKGQGQIVFVPSLNN